MVKRSRKEKIFILFLPVLALVSVLTLVISLLVFSQASYQELEPFISDGQFDPSQQQAYFNGQPVAPPKDSLAEAKESVEGVLSATTDDSKWIEIDLTHQILKAWDGNRLVYEFLVSTGKRQWGTATPVGVYRIWIKLKNTTMKGGEGSHYYYLPNVPCAQYFYKGFGIHGAYWHDNFGHPMSHGCVNLSPQDACLLFYWTSPLLDEGSGLARPDQDDLGTRVVVHGQTPWE